VERKWFGNDIMVSFSISILYTILKRMSRDWSDDPPVAGFTSSTPDEISQTTVFINISQDGGDAKRNVVYAWNFGDGTFSTAQHPTNAYGIVYEPLT
jgi:PKD repeat protein